LRCDVPSALPLFQDKSTEDFDLVAREWKQLVNDFVRAVHANTLALKQAKRGDYRMAARIWLRACKSRFCDAKILFNLAVCYQNGLGISKDLAKVIDNNLPMKVTAVNHLSAVIVVLF